MLTETSAYKLLSEYILSVSHGCIPRNGSAELHGNSMFNFFETLPDCFPKWLHHFIFPAAIHRGSVCVSCLVSSDSLQHLDCSPPGPSVHGILQARTLEWVAISFSKRNYRKKESEVTQSCLTLCDPMDCSLPSSSIHGSFQARGLEWVAISFATASL